MCSIWTKTGITNPNSKRILVLVQGINTFANGIEEHEQFWKNFLTNAENIYGGIVFFSYDRFTSWPYEQSDTAHSIFEQHVPLLRERLRGCLAKDATIQSFDLVGHSMGGVVINEYIKAYGFISSETAAQKVAHILTIDSPVNGSKRAYCTNTSALWADCFADLISPWAIKGLTPTAFLTPAGYDLGELWAAYANTLSQNIKTAEMLACRHTLFGLGDSQPTAYRNISNSVDFVFNDFFDREWKVSPTYSKEYNLGQWTEDPSGHEIAITHILVYPELKNDVRTYFLAAPSTSHCKSTQTQTPPPPSEPPPPIATNNAAFIQHVTLADGATVNSGQSVEKIWRIRNTGTSTWNSSYQFAFVSGNRLGAPSSTTASTVAPGQEMTIRFTWTIPSGTADGTYRGVWRMRDPQGNYFGHEVAFNLRVIRTNSPAPSSGGIEIVSVNVPSSVRPGEQFNVSVTIRANNGELRESRGDHLHALDENSSNTFFAYPVQGVRGTIPAGQNFTFNDSSGFRMTAPSQTGQYNSRWQLRVEGNYIGPVINIPINVQPGSPPPPTPQGWKTEYFTYKNMDTGKCRGDEYLSTTYIFQNWGGGSPGGCPTDQFAVRYTRTFYFSGGSYRFHCHKNNGCRVFIDGQLQIDAWWIDPEEFGGVDRTLNISAGNHEIRAEFFDERGDARYELWWTGPGFFPNWDVCDPTQWCGEYYGSRDASPSDAPALKRNEGTGALSRDFGMGGPISGGDNFGFPLDNFSARWTRTIYFDAGQYRFNVGHDDGVRLYVDDTERLNQWGSCCRTDFVDLWLTSGNHRITVIWYDSGGAANVNLWWEQLAACYGIENTITPSGSGSITYDPPPNCPGDNTKYQAGTSVNLVANPTNSSEFLGWGGDAAGDLPAASLFMNSPKQIEAVFMPCYALSLTPTSNGTNVVYPEPDCKDGSLYRAGTEVSVYAVPDSEFSLFNWSGDLAGDANPFTLTINETTEVAGNFVAFQTGVTSVSPDSPYCVLRSSEYIEDRTLVVNGENLPTTGHHLQFRRVDNNADSIHFGFEVNWQSSSQLSVDIAAIKQHLWSDSMVALKVRLTDGSYTPISDWSLPFMLADDEGVCGAALPKPVPCTDAYESNDSAELAQSIGVGEPQTHAFCVDNDHDWFSFTAEPSQEYTIDTLNLATDTDTILQLYADDKSTLLAEDDDGGSSFLASQLKIIPTVSTTYYVRASQYGSLGNSAFTYQVSLTSQAIPPPEVPVLATPANEARLNEDAEIVLSWQTAPRAQTYYAELLQSDGATINSTVQPELTWNVGQLPAGIYSWWVQANNDSGSSNMSEPAWNFVVVPNAPSELQASAPSCQQIELTWQDNSSGESGYAIYRNNELINMVASDSTTYSDFWVEPTTHTYYVVALSAADSSETSNSVQIVAEECTGPAPLERPIPLTPANEARLVEGSQILLTWQAVTGATTYAAELWPNYGEMSYSGKMGETSWDLGVGAIGFYNWHVEAYDDFGFSGWSEPMWSFTIVPMAPVLLDVTASSCTEILLQWQDNSQVEESYEIYRNDLLVASITANATSYTDGGLDANTDYSYKVLAFSGGLISDASNTMTTATSECPVPEPDPDPEPNPDPEPDPDIPNSGEMLYLPSARR